VTSRIVVTVSVELRDPADLRQDPAPFARADFRGEALPWQIAEDDQFGGAIRKAVGDLAEGAVEFAIAHVERLEGRR
jgi:hypothetical protein